MSQATLAKPSSIRPLTQAELDFYRENGYVIVRGLFDTEEMELVRSVCQSDPKLEDALKLVIDNQGRTWGAAVWAGLNDSLVSVVTQTARMVEAAEAITGEPCYFMYSKIVQKPAHDQSIVYWHQGFPAWHYDGCPFPDLFASCSIAVNQNTKDNGCLQVIEKSHLLGRIDHVAEGNAAKVRCDPSRITRALEHLKVVDCEMETGDVVFFHGNTIHGSVENNTDGVRILMHCHYNAMINRPSVDKPESHPCVPLKKVPDSAIKDGLYQSGFESNSESWNWYNVEPETYAKS
ncbi:MAG: phytanoyl-CoA dioxygenase family protein [Leptolyngbyaceae cyanobacterium]